MGFKLHSASVRGPAHIASDMPNQDATLTRHWRHGWLAVVSDGMGSRPHSDIGSRCACKAVLQTCRGMGFGISDKDFIRDVYKNWLTLLGTIKPDEAAATCLIAWGQSSGDVRLFQLGDGAILFEAEVSGMLSARKPSSFSNETTGLGVSRRYSDWQSKKIQLNASNHGVALMTDGISDDLEQTDGFVSDMIEQMKNMSTRYGKEWIRRELESWPTPSHSDDKTIALIFRK